MLKFLSLILSLQMYAVAAAAVSSEFMVSIDRAFVTSPKDLQRAKEDLTFRLNERADYPVDCDATSTMIRYLGSENFGTSAPYHGIAFVRVESACEASLRQAVHIIVDDGRYTLYSNPRISR